MKKVECTKFQNDTVDHIISLFKKNDRVLLADEVGLGKTIVAKEVIKRLSSLKDTYRVLYVCSNQILAAQNIRKLGVDSDSLRLSMLFLNLGDFASGLRVIPVSPRTSVNTNNGGIKKERILIFNVLMLLVPFQSKKNEIRQLLQFGFKWSKAEEKEFNDSLSSHEKIISCFVENYLEQSDLGKRLKERIAQPARKKQDGDKELICDLRKMLVRYTLSLLKVDLVIMDEFQNFRDLLESSKKKVDESEENILYEYFLNEKVCGNAKILLMSATPYRPFTSESEDSPFSHYEDFIQLFNFLYYGKESVKFEESWKSYANKLNFLSKKTFQHCVEEKRKVENLLFQTCSRTERFNKSCILQHKSKELDISKKDILNYIEAQKLCSQLNVGNFKIDYAKSTPFVLSFMDDKYIEKKKCLENLKQKKHKNHYLSKSKNILISKEHFEKYCDIQSVNSKYSVLSKELFYTNGKENNFERLLWIPASKCYYEPNKKSAFWKNKNASKILVFSAWRMVPKAIVALTSYESECRMAHRGEKYEKANYQRIEEGTIFDFCSPKLAAYFDPSKYTKATLQEVKNDVLKSVKGNVKKVWENGHSSKFNAKLALEVVKLISSDNEIVKRLSFDFNKMCDFIANYIIASPVECFYRIYNNKACAENAARTFRAMFNRLDAAMCVNAECTYGKYLERVFEYCVQGNLQAVLDEYLFVSGCEKEKFSERIRNDYNSQGEISADTLESLSGLNKDRENNKFNFRVHFSTGYYKDSLDNGSSSNLGHKIDAFNSPFRPFVFATTSVGEEGLDFHKYCRKILHWNLPENPIEFEQREGRINRFCNLAIRQNLSELFGSTMKNTSELWDHILKKANDFFKSEDESGISPYWSFPSKIKVSNKIESIVPEFPFSKDQNKLDNIYNVIELYRIALGQPNQEAVLNSLLGSGLDKKQLKELEMSLSPYFRKNNKD